MNDSAEHARLKTLLRAYIDSQPAPDLNGAWPLPRIDAAGVDRYLTLAPVYAQAAFMGLPPDVHGTCAADIADFIAALPATERRAHRTRPPRRRAPAGAHAGLSARAPGRRNAAPAAAGLRPGRHRHGPAGRQSGRAAVPVLRSRRGPARQCAGAGWPARPAAGAAPDAARELVAETLRIDPPIHNTRRFLADEINVDGQRIAAGQTVLLVLAAAALAQPDTPWTFGALGHACPGQDAARRDAAGALAHLLRAGADAPALAARHRYRRCPTPAFPCLTAPRTHTHDRRDLRSRTRPGRSQALSGHRRHPDRRAEGHRRLHFRRALPEPEHAGQAAVAVVLAR
ncbi:cytochrome [Achromobacter xylosoxidans]